MTYELRIYHATPGKISNLLTRFRDHTVDLFAKHGMHSVAYWVDNALPNDLIYVIKHSGEPAANWEAFLTDPDWIAAKSASEIEGSLVVSIDSRYMSATDFSKLQ
jgi:hypothetical protein